ncbi:MAG: hypothetical protein QNJ71_07885 [Acidimicrobiia bacterium]|nr:hypothetical protein [Acidimicrobiia bacterium]
MTIYELSQALKRYRVAVIIAFTVLILAVLLMSFTIEDGSPSFRSGLKYESSVQIAVVNRNLDSLTTTDATPGELEGNANLYAQLLGSDEAAKWIGEQNGFKLDEAVSTDVERGSTVITATVIAPTADQARAAALSTFDWLSLKLLEPVTTADFPSPPTTLPTVDLDGQFTSFLNVIVDQNAARNPDGLFLTVEIGGIPTVTLAMSEAGTTRTRATLQRIMTLVLTLTDSGDQVLDTIRIAPPPGPTQVQVPPELTLVLGERSIRVNSTEDDGITTTFSTNDIETFWSDGFVTVQEQLEATNEVGLALLTTEPGFLTSGGRRGPILAAAMLVVGTLLILAVVIVADTWRSQREVAVAGGAGATTTGAAPEPATTSVPATAATDDDGSPNGNRGARGKRRRSRQPADAESPTEVESRTDRPE